MCYWVALLLLQSSKACVSVGQSPLTTPEGLLSIIALAFPSAPRAWYVRALISTAVSSPGQPPPGLALPRGRCVLHQVSPGGGHSRRARPGHGRGMQTRVCSEGRGQGKMEGPATGGSAVQGVVRSRYEGSPTVRPAPHYVMLNAW